MSVLCNRQHFKFYVTSTSDLSTYFGDGIGSGDDHLPK